jgi:hypothetical protein
VGAALLGALAFFLWRRKKRTVPDALDEKMVSHLSSSSSRSVTVTDWAHPTHSSIHHEPLGILKEPSIC